MALRIADPVVVGKVERLAERTGLRRMAVVDRALDLLISETSGATDQKVRLAALLAQLDRISDRTDASDPLEWDDHGLPR